MSNTARDLGIATSPSVHRDHLLVYSPEKVTYYDPWGLLPEWKKFRMKSSERISGVFDSPSGRDWTL